MGLGTATGGPFTFKVGGLQGLQIKLGNLLKKYPEHAMDATENAAERLVTEIKEVHVPIRWGNLRDSARVVRKKDSVDITFGNNAVGYAIAVHEIERPHKVGHWKYVEIPLNAYADKFVSDVAKACEAAVKSI